ncbi:MAG TPA: hypothetical protein VJ461_01040 [Candidatus Nanoarchaeia archaeon]|nr:hypothetical protein [Candidatus Nanoarchaeia archaeon]
MTGEAEKKDYEPKYAVGEILVCFLGNLNAEDGFVRKMSEFLGYQVKDEEYEFGESYIILTKPGEEEKACNEFKSFRIKDQEWVDWAARRDIKLEKRWNDLEELVGMAESLRDDPEYADVVYNKKLDEIIDYANKIKEPGKQ